MLRLCDLGSNMVDGHTAVAKQDDVVPRFATSGIVRFATGGCSTLPTGEPINDGAVSWVRARIVQRIPLGSSYLVSLSALESGVGEVVCARVPRPRVPPHRPAHRDLTNVGDSRSK